MRPRYERTALKLDNGYTISIIQYRENNEDRMARGYSQVAVVHPSTGWEDMAVEEPKPFTALEIAHLIIETSKLACLPA